MADVSPSRRPAVALGLDGKAGGVPADRRSRHSEREANMGDPDRRVAVIGSGITGLSAAWLLHRSVA